VKEEAMLLQFDFCPVEMVPMEQIELDPRFNREILEQTVRQIESDPDPDKFGVIQGARLNGNGKVTIYDGGHRFEWLRRNGFAGEVPVAIGHMTDPHVLAVKFVDMNTARRPVSPWERYRKLLFAEVPMYVAIDRDVQEIGWTVGPKAVEHVVTAPPLVRLYSADAENAIRETLSLARDTWDGRFKSTDPNLLQGIWLMISGASLNRDDVVDRLSTHEPSDLLGRARERKARERGTIARNVSREMLRVVRRRNPEVATSE
jgi:hypothetical protein